VNLRKGRGSEGVMDCVGCNRVVCFCSLVFFSFSLVVVVVGISTLDERLAITAAATIAESELGPDCQGFRDSSGGDKLSICTAIFFMVGELMGVIGPIDALLLCALMLFEAIELGSKVFSAKALKTCIDPLRGIKMGESGSIR